MDDSLTPDGSTPAPGVMQSPFCAELRSKKFFMLDVLPTEAEQYIDDSGYCWCYLTQQIVGPDGRQAGPDSCVPGRGCYQSALEG